jgi:serine/threonine-protein kinase
VAVDIAGTVYIGDTYNNAVKEWTPANNFVSTLVTSGLSYPMGIAVDGGGNVYIADRNNHLVKKWTMLNSAVTTLPVSGLWSPTAVAVDDSGNVYIADSANNTITEMPHAFVDPTAKVEGAADGQSARPVRAHQRPAVANHHRHHQRRGELCL